jgi:hypothetical protein
MKRYDGFRMSPRGASTATVTLKQRLRALTPRLIGEAGPSVKAGAADPVLAAKLSRRKASLMLLQNPDNLLF